MDGGYTENSVSPRYRVREVTGKNRKRRKEKKNNKKEMMVGRMMIDDDDDDDNGGDNDEVLSSLRNSELVGSMNDPFVWQPIIVLFAYASSNNS